jgi:Lanthionine synthetase C-like protein
VPPRGCALHERTGAPTLEPPPAPRRPLLDGSRRERALDVAAEVLARGAALLERDDRGSTTVAAHVRGAVLIADALARSGRTPPCELRALLERALVIAPNRLGLHDGAAGLLVLLDVLDPARAAFGKARARLRELLAAAVAGAVPPELPAADMDLIGGVAGHAVALRDTVPEMLPALRAYAERFVSGLEARVRAPGARDAFATGDPWLDLGVAHGVAGMLAALNAALPHERALAARYTGVLLATSQRIGGAHRWDAGWQPAHRAEARLSWCYQTLGIAAVLRDRAVLDGDAALRALADDAVRAVLCANDRKPPADDCLCHGRAGIATILWRFAPDGDVFARGAVRAAHDVLDAFDERLPLGYRSYDMGDGRSTDRPDFLDGAFGIALFLADAATAHERRWLPLLGLIPD